LLPLLQKVQKNGEGFKACCPAHDDRNPSLSVKEDEQGKVLLHCFAGCQNEAIVRALGISLRDLYPRVDAPVSQQPNRPQPHRRPTLDELAADKGLPVHFLRSLGLHDLEDGQGVGIPYRDASGSDLYLKRRVALVAKEGSFWPKGVPLMVYGQERLSEAREH